MKERTKIKIEYYGGPFYDSNIYIAHVGEDRLFLDIQLTGGKYLPHMGCMLFGEYVENCSDDEYGPIFEEFNNQFSVDAQNTVKAKFVDNLVLRMVRLAEKDYEKMMK